MLPRTALDEKNSIADSERLEYCLLTEMSLTYDILKERDQKFFDRRGAKVLEGGGVDFFFGGGSWYFFSISPNKLKRKKSKNGGGICGSQPHPPLAS